MCQKYPDNHDDFSRERQYNIDTVYFGAADAIQMQEMGRKEDCYADSVTQVFVCQHHDKRANIRVPLEDDTVSLMHTHSAIMLVCM